MLIKHTQKDIVFFLSRAGAGVLVIAAAIIRDQAAAQQGSTPALREIGRRHLSLSQARALVAELTAVQGAFVVDPSLSLDPETFRASVMLALEAPTAVCSPYACAVRALSYAEPVFETRDAILSYQKTRGPNL
jgi:hypothetical protein